MVKNSGLLLGIMLAVIFSACASKPVSSGSVAIPSDIAGIVHAGNTNTPEEYALLDRLGVTWLLRTFNWHQIEPSEGQWNFDTYDKYVDTAKAAGKKIVGILAYDVPWIHEDGERRRYIPPDKIDYFLNYVRKTVSHFQGRVDVWCIWNEPNHHFWTGTRNEYLVLARYTADAVREVDSDVLLLGGGFNRGIFGLPKAYIRGKFETGGMEKTDAIAFHPYELNPARTLKLYRRFHKLVAEYGFEDRIWITEVGYPTGGRYPTRVKEKIFPEYVVKTFVNLAAEGAPVILWYQLFDPIERSNKNSENFFGLVRSREDYTSKGAEAFRLCAVHLAGTVYRPDLPRREKLPPSLKTFYFECKDNSGGTLVLWKNGSPKNVKISIKAGNSATAFAVHDPVSGSAVEIQTATGGVAGTVLKVGSMPVFVTWQGGGIPVLE